MKYMIIIQIETVGSYFLPKRTSCRKSDSKTNEKFRVFFYVGTVLSGIYLPVEMYLVPMLYSSM